MHEIFVVSTRIHLTETGEKYVVAGKVKLLWIRFMKINVCSLQFHLGNSWDTSFDSEQRRFDF